MTLCKDSKNKTGKMCTSLLCTYNSSCINVFYLFTESTTTDWTTITNSDEFENAGRKIDNSGQFFVN